MEGDGAKTNEGRVQVAGFNAGPYAKRQAVQDCAVHQRVSSWACVVCCDPAGAFGHARDYDSKKYLSHLFEFISPYEFDEISTLEETVEVEKKGPIAEITFPASAEEFSPEDCGYCRAQPRRKRSRRTPTGFEAG